MRSVDARRSWRLSARRAAALSFTAKLVLPALGTRFVSEPTDTLRTRLGLLFASRRFETSAVTTRREPSALS